MLENSTKIHRFLLISPWICWKTLKQEFNILDLQIWAAILAGATQNCFQIVRIVKKSDEFLRVIAKQALRIGFLMGSCLVTFA